MSADLSPERVRELFDYDPLTGLLKWKQAAGRWGRIKAGSTAGGVSTGGYLQVRVDGKSRMVHRMAWIHANGAIETEMIDHINGDRTDNRLCNLRQATRAINTQNIKRANSLSRHGRLGITPNHKAWKALISINGKQRYLGTFKTADEAQAAYLAAKRQLHEGCTL